MSGAILKVERDMEDAVDVKLWEDGDRMHEELTRKTTLEHDKHNPGKSKGNRNSRAENMFIHIIHISYISNPHQYFPIIHTRFPSNPIPNSIFHPTIKGIDPLADQSILERADQSLGRSACKQCPRSPQTIHLCPTTRR